jgi:hypothetical protein
MAGKVHYLVDRFNRHLRKNSQEVPVGKFRIQQVSSMEIAGEKVLGELPNDSDQLSVGLTFQTALQMDLASLRCHKLQPIPICPRLQLLRTGSLSART